MLTGIATTVQAGTVNPDAALAPSPGEEAQKKAAAVGVAAHIAEDDLGGMKQLWGLYKVMGVPLALLALLCILFSTAAIYLWQMVSQLSHAESCGLVSPPPP